MCETRGGDASKCSEHAGPRASASASPSKCERLTEQWHSTRQQAPTVPHPPRRACPPSSEQLRAAGARLAKSSAIPAAPPTLEGRRDRSFACAIEDGQLGRGRSRDNVAGGTQQHA
jgi:hypothetical protein